VSVLNQASDGLFNVLIVVIRALVRFGPKEREELVLCCGGAVESLDAGQLTRTLNRWTELGLLIEENGAVNIAEPYRSKLGSEADVAERRLPMVARAVAMLQANNRRFWESEENRSADLSRGVAWMLAQDVYTLDASAERLAILEVEQVLDGGKHHIVQNNTRWNGLKAWMLYLGFARDNSKWFVDPTNALRDVLGDIFEAREELTGPDFVSQAASILPVLDGGVYRTQVEAALKDSALLRARAGLLSTSLSRAMQRLDREGSIQLAHRSDSGEVVSLTGSNGRIWREVSLVKIVSRRDMR
jgi:hypothetical protein